MKLTTALTTAMTVFLFCLAFDSPLTMQGPTSVYADEKVAAESTKLSENTDEKSKYEMPSYPNRLPPNYGKLGLSDEQKDKVYSIQSRYYKQIQELEKQLAEIREQEAEEISKILTPGQRLRLQEIFEAKAREDAEKEAEDKK